MDAQLVTAAMAASSLLELTRMLPDHFAYIPLPTSGFSDEVRRAYDACRREFGAQMRGERDRHDDITPLFEELWEALRRERASLRMCEQLPEPVQHVSVPVPLPVPVPVQTQLLLLVLAAAAAAALGLLCRAGSAAGGPALC